MGWGYGNIGGGGTAGLNFEIIGKTSRPVNPKPNTIWVNTSVEITDWAFSATEPINPVNGMVWFNTSSYSSAPINALKKHELNIYPVGCQQRISGRWVGKSAETYIDNKWTAWDMYIYNLGNENINLTGGWNAHDMGKFTKNADNMEISGTANGASTLNPIDITPYSKAIFHVNTSSGSYKDVGFSKNKYNYDAASVRFNNTFGYVDKEVNISGLSGMYYPTIYTEGGSGVSVQSIKLLV